MDFQQLLAKMNELSQPAPASTAVAEQPVAECPPAMGPGPMGGDMGGMDKPDTPPPSISVNLNAQGLDNIEQLLDLIKAVNPDATPAAQVPPITGAPVIDIEPMDKPAGGLGLGNLDSGPLKMLPDLDAPGDDVSKAQGDLDNDGDHDMDDHNMEKEPVEIDPIDKDGKEDGEADNDEDEGTLGTIAGGIAGAAMGGPMGALSGAAAGDQLTDPDPEEKEEGAYGNSLGDSEPETKGVDAAVHAGGDLNKPKTMTKHSYRQGDNPMAMEGEELRAWIKSELTQRLAEAKGAK